MERQLLTDFKFDTLPVAIAAVKRARVVAIVCLAWRVGWIAICYVTIRETVDHDQIDHIVRVDLVLNNPRPFDCKQHFRVTNEQRVRAWLRSRGNMQVGEDVVRVLSEVR